MAEQAPTPAPTPEPLKKPSRRRKVDPAKLKQLRAKEAVVSVVPPVKPLTPAQLQTPAPQPAEPQSNEREREGKVLEQLFTQALRRVEAVKPAEDTGMKLIQAISSSIAHAEPVGKLDALMLPHLGEMTSKSHLMLMALQYHNVVERIALYSMARWTLEKGLWTDLIGGSLSPVEKLALLQLTIKEMDKAQELAIKFKDDLEKGGRGTTADIETTSEKMDRAIKKENKEDAKELAGTSPTGREVVRRMLDKANNILEQKVKEAINPPPPQPPKQ